MVAAVVGSLAALPLPTLIGGAVLLLVALAVFVRATANLRRGNAPPVDEGIPFVGGLLAFSKVGPGLWRRASGRGRAPRAGAPGSPWA